MLCITYGYDDEYGEAKYGQFNGAGTVVDLLGYMVVISSLILLLKHFVVVVPPRVILWQLNKKGALGHAHAPNKLNVSFFC